MYLKEIPCISLPYLCMCVNLSFAMVLDNTTSPDYQLCVKTMYQARDKEIVKVPWCSILWQSFKESLGYTAPMGVPPKVQPMFVSSA